MKIVTVVGARPQFIKCAPVSRELRKHATEILVHTGQHYDDIMSEVFFRELHIQAPNYNLGVGSGPQGKQTGEMLKRIEEVLTKERPNIVLVYGDTNSTLAGSLAAAKVHSPVAHVEAGLRSFNKKMPEEINRVLTDHVSNLLFCPTETAVANLAREGITDGVHQVGDVMYDSILYNLHLAEERSLILRDLELQPAGYALATVHRAENTDEPQRLRSIFEALEEIARSLTVVVPLHPRTRKQLGPQDTSAAGLRIIDPVSYLDMLVLEKHARVILTDSGGVQKEAFLLQVPCVTMREDTEWVETISSGWNSLVGTDTRRIIDAALNVTTGSFSIGVALYGHGDAAKRITEVILSGSSTKRGRMCAETPGFEV